MGIIEESATAGLSEFLGAAVGGNKFLASHVVLRIGFGRDNGNEKVMMLVFTDNWVGIDNRPKL